MIDLPPPTYEQTIEAVVACGIPAPNIHVAYRDDMQSDAVIISSLGEVTDGKLRCLYGAVHPYYLVLIEDRQQYVAYLEFGTEEGRRREKAEAIEWLRAAGMLNRVPRYDPAVGITHFAEAVEKACSVPPGTALKVFDSSTLTFRPDFLESFLRAQTADGNNSFACLGRIIAASNADDHDVRLGIIGNAALDHSNS